MKGQAREGTGWSRGRENFDWYVNNNNSNSYFKILQLSGEAERQTAIVFFIRFVFYYPNPVQYYL